MNFEKKESPSAQYEDWDVSDIDPTQIFPKDCRYYNGGAIAPIEERKNWEGYDEEGDLIDPEED